MGQIRHGSATTTHAVRAAIQRSQASIAALSEAFGINPKTVAKWRTRKTVEDQKTGPKAPRSTVSHPMNTSAKYGLQSQKNSSSTQAIKSRD
jgi:transposase-like protein